MEEQHFVRTYRKGPILLITMDRPKVNAINHAMSRALYRAYQELQESAELMVAIFAARMSGSFRLVGI